MASCCRTNDYKWLTQPQQETCCSALSKRISARNDFSGFHFFADHTPYTLKKKPCCAENTQYPPNEFLLVCKWPGCSSERLFLGITFACQDYTEYSGKTLTDGTICCELNTYSDLGHDVLKSGVHFIPDNDHHQCNKLRYLRPAHLVDTYVLRFSLF